MGLYGNWKAESRDNPCHLLAWAAMDYCYNDEGAPSRCMPEFENIAFNRTVLASNVCGSTPEDYCMQTGSTRSCHSCDMSDPELSHNASLLTDFHRNEEPTWWQSQSMYYGIQHPNSVNITLHLGKAFEITLHKIEILHHGSCKQTYGKDAKAFIRPGDYEQTALCTDEFSDISPLTGGNVAFSTLEGRPSAYNFDQSVVLQRAHPKSLGPFVYLGEFDSQYALGDIDPLIIKLWEINISQEYIDWVANLSADLPNTLSPSLHLLLTTFLLNNKMRRPIIECDLFSH
ncbi:hypothetical protein L3Q82_012483 [Scortum barcoo]|uniref:Uncharacterized protein n=1 Tax=Scortum barcoo TaxID=214431 RepID=A0ACB8W3C9_9TELE|nr:hypothetical protein L3Q82_012483 [Scortum barcoo]